MGNYGFSCLPDNVESGNSPGKIDRVACKYMHALRTALTNLLVTIRITSGRNAAILKCRNISSFVTLDAGYRKLLRRCIGDIHGSLFALQSLAEAHRGRCLRSIYAC